MPIEEKQKKKEKRERNNLMKMFAKDSLVQPAAGGCGKYIYDI